MRTQDWADLGIILPAGAAGEIDTTCPQCSHTRKKTRAKCLSVNTETGVYYCHHCGWAGGIATNGDNYGAPLLKLAARPAPRRVYVTPEPPPATPLAQSVVAWFAARGIPDSVLIRAGISAGREFCPQLGSAKLAIRFPYVRDGRLVNIKYRTRDKHFWMVRGAQRILYGLDDIAGVETICIVEGEIDKLSIDAAGGPATVSVPDGAPAVNASHYESKFSFLDETAMAHLRAATTVLIATDMDAPGEKLANELARRIGYVKCRRVSWPKKCKDANEVLVARSTQAIRDALDAAQPCRVPVSPGHGGQVAHPMRVLPSVRGRRPVLDLSIVECRHGC